MPKKDLYPKFSRAAVLYEKGRTLRAAAAIVGVSPSGLMKHMKRYDLPRRGPRRTLHLPAEEVAELIRLHHDEHMSLRQIARATGHDRETIRDQIRKAGKLTFSAKIMRRLQRDLRDSEVRDDVFKLRKSGFTIREIGRQLKTDTLRVSRILKEANGGLTLEEKTQS